MIRYRYNHTFHLEREIQSIQLLQASRRMASNVAAAEFDVRCTSLCSTSNASWLRVNLSVCWTNRCSKIMIESAPLAKDRLEIVSVWRERRVKGYCAT